MIDNVSGVDLSFLKPFPLSWQTCIRDFLAESCNSEETLRNYTRYLSQFFARYPMLTPEAVSQSEVIAFVRSPSRTHRNNPDGSPSPSLQNGRLNALQGMFKFAARYTITGSDGSPSPLMQRALPTAGLRFKSIPINPKGLSPAEVKAFFSAIPTNTSIGKRDRAIFLFYLYSMRRRSEVIRLKWGDIQATTIMESNGQRRQGWQYVFTSKGNGVQKFTAELPKPVWDAILDMLEAEGRLTTIRPDDYLFVSYQIGVGKKHHVTDRPLPPGNVEVRMKKYLRAANLPDYGIHVWRHTSAQSRYKGGQSFFEVMVALGHKSPAHTARYLSNLVSSSDSGAKIIEQQYGML